MVRWRGKSRKLEHSLKPRDDYGLGSMVILTTSSALVLLSSLSLP